jgi:glycosyltransferase involved in cell wall biosynthesis
VTVITGAPNFPEGRLFAGYRNRWHRTETLDGIRVVRVKTYITANEGTLGRMLDYLSFLPTSLVAGLFEPRPDVGVGTSPQLFTVCSGALVALLRRGAGLVVPPGDPEALARAVLALRDDGGLRRRLAEASAAAAASHTRSAGAARMLEVLEAVAAGRWPGDGR